MITQSELKELLDYDPETGVFIWKKKVANRVKIGDIAGCLDISTGYIVFMIKGKRYRAHRLAWFYIYGEWPKDQIDHINHVRDDNRIVNLREVTRQENLKNASLSKNNKSDVTGVHWYKANKEWRAQIMVNGKYIHLGYFNDKHDAAMTRKEAEIKYEYHENHGGV